MVGIGRISYETNSLRGDCGSAFAGLFACRTEPAVEAFSEATSAPAAPTAASTTEPMPEPTAEPTPETEEPEPTEEPTPAPTPEPITRERLDMGEFDAFFDGAVFVGDSMTKEFETMCANSAS